MLTFNYSYSDTNRLFLQDRDFARRSRALFIRNNPAGVTAGNPPPLGYLPNIRSSTGANLVLKNGTPLNSPFTSVPRGYAGLLHALLWVTRGALRSGIRSSLPQKNRILAR